MASALAFPGVALITGAAADVLIRTTGIGRAIASAFAREGCMKIVIADLTESTLKEAHSEIEAKFPNVQVLSCVVDVSSPGDVQNLLDQAIEKFGRVDYAVNAAGILGASKRSHEMSVEEFDKVLQVDYRGCWLSSREELKHMVQQEPLPSYDGRPGNRGAIVNIASQLGIVARPTAPSYCGSKAAVIHMTKADAIDVSTFIFLTISGSRIQFLVIHIMSVSFEVFVSDRYSFALVNCVCPGLIGTAMVMDNLEYFKPAIGISPMKRYGTVEEVADCVLFLCSSKATFVQGAAFVVDGGYTIN
ncbi:oxidoreductase [Penicillium angulare]|uniref:Oxidoreductase n=1 Tax=Penicillium angulare TaxID=116970 RepID=A0A9W9KIE4_9EURO|nr:oxidoreductase [Penicillium angulare]